MDGTVWVGAASALGGVALTGAISLLGESRRRRHERESRDLELREAHRARLHSERRQAYAHFYRCHMRELVADRALTNSMLELESHHEDDRREEANAEYERAFSELVSAGAETDEALMLVELVASTPVRDTVRELRKARSRVPQFIAADDVPEAGDARDRLRAEIAQGEAAMRDAIRDELELDR